MPERQLEQKYGLFTAICMVVGVVIGAGVFFKAQSILQKTGGDLGLGIAAWLIGGAIMLACILAFAVMARKYAAAGGVMDYAEAVVGPRYAYFVGWFLATVYYPTLASVLCWLSARYTLEFLTACWPNLPLRIPASAGGCADGPECMALTLLYLCAAYAVNALAPKLAGKLLTSVTVIKLIPLVLMAVVGLLAGFFSPTHMLAKNFAAAPAPGAQTGGALLGAVCSAAFAYEGWIVATSISGELKDAKRNLPKSLVTGSLIVIAVYNAYYLGVAGGAEVQALIERGASEAYVNLFGGRIGNLLTLFVAISCLGTLNGLMLGCTRGMYALAARGQGPRPDLFGQIDAKSNMPANSAAFGLLSCAFWTVYYFLVNVVESWTGVFAFDSSELPVITLYLFYIPIFLCWMQKGREEPPLRRYVLPALAVAGAGFMVYASIVSHGIANVWYLIVFAAVMLIGAPYRRKNNGGTSG